MAATPLMHGLRLGTVVEVHNLPDGDLNGKFGQVVEWIEGANKFVVALVNGVTTEIDHSCLRMVDSARGMPGQGGGKDSFDLLVGPRLRDELLGEAIAKCLFEKGFCVLKVCASPQTGDLALTHMKDMQLEQRLARLPEEIEEGWLGTGAKGMVAWLSEGKADSPQDEGLRESDRFLTYLGSLLQASCADACEATIADRTTGLVSLSLTDVQVKTQQYPHPFADDKVLGDYYNTWRHSVVKAVHIVGPGTATVTLDSSGSDTARELPLRQQQVQIEAAPNTIVLFRTGCFDYSCEMKEPTISLTVTFMEQKQSLEFGAPGDDSLWLQAGGEGPAAPPLDNFGGHINVINTACRLGGGWDTPEGYGAGTTAGTDSMEFIPIMRFDVMQYYCHDWDYLLPDQMIVKHMMVVDNLEMFDNKYFEIPLQEARGMDPMQRQTLEVGAQLLWKQGITKKTSNRTPSHAGFSVGLDKDDFTSYPLPAECLGGNNVQAIISNRFSFVFNLRGPNYVADTACSSALLATHLAKFLLQNREWDPLDFHLALGIHQCLMPGPFIGSSQGHMISRCCRTFDASAAGYGRGEGCSGLTLKWGDLQDEREAIWRASQGGQNGRSATLTAPNGLAQEDVIVKTLREARMHASESTFWSCHGTGTILGDPIEVSCVKRVMGKSQMARTTAMTMGTNKTNTGHLEGGAAMTSLISAVLQLGHGKATGVVHFHQLNPNLEAANFDSNLINEFVQFGQQLAIANISSFGFGGTNGHCVLWGENNFGREDAKAVFMKRLASMAPPEVTVTGPSPATWLTDLPDKKIKPGDRYTIDLKPDDPVDKPMKYIKLESAADDEDWGAGDAWAIAGNFNDWEMELMHDGDVLGLNTAVVEVPEIAQVEFRLHRNADAHEVLGPAVDKCSRMAAQIVGPKAGLQNVWQIDARPGGQLRIDFFCNRGLRSIAWMEL